MAGKKYRQVLVGGWVLAAALGTCTGLVRGWGGSDGSVPVASSGFSWSSGETLEDSPITFDDCSRCHPSDENLVRHHELIATAGRDCRECHEIDDNEPGNYQVRVERKCRTCHHLEVHREIRHRIGSCGPCHTATGGEIIALHRGGDSLNETLDACCRCHGTSAPLVRETIARGQAGWEISCRDCHGSVRGTTGKERQKQ